MTQPYHPKALFISPFYGTQFNKVAHSCCVGEKNQTTNSQYLFYYNLMRLFKSVAMKNGRRNTLNWEADKRFGDPTAVSDPACWITGHLVHSLRTALPERFAISRHAPKYQVDVGFDISGDVIIGEDGKLRLKT